MAKADRVPPFDQAAEESVLGSCLLSKVACAKAVDMLRPPDFHNPRHQQAFEVITLLHKADEPVDPVTVAGGLSGAEDDVRPWLHSLTIDTPAVSAVGHYAEIVLRHSKSRSLIWVGSDLVDAGYEGQPATDVANL